LHLIDDAGRIAQHTGPGPKPWAGHMHAENVSVAKGGAGGSDRDLMPPGDTVAGSPAATSQTLRSVKRVLRGKA